MEGNRLGDYVLGKQLGAGGMGTVYRAEGPDGVVAVKLLHRHLLSAPGAFKRFLREAELGRRIEQPIRPARLSDRQTRIVCGDR